jgi:type II secretory pathway component PulF
VPLYRYEALDRTGKTVVGAMQVADEQMLATRLNSMGYQPTSIQIAQSQVGSGRDRSRTIQGTVTAPRSPLSASKRSVARLFHQLHMSFRAGMPAYQALTTVAGQVHEAPLRQALMEISVGVRDGLTLSELMERYPRLFTRGDVGMIRAAEMAGFLPDALASLAAQHEEDDNTGRRLRIWVWFFHANVAGAFLILPAIFWVKDSIPALDVRAGLPAAGWAFSTLTVPLLCLYFGGLAAFSMARHHPGLAYRWHRLLLRLPVVGKISFLRSNAVFTRTLQQLYHAGVAPATAWATASGAVPNLYLGERHAGGQPVVESTARFSAAMQQVGLLEPTDAGMVATGEATGEVPQALSYLANRYEEETRVALGASVVRGAVLFTLWAFLVGALAIGLFAWAYGQGALGILGTGEG